MSDGLPQYVEINGQMIDINDPCALYPALVGYKLKVATGGVVQEIEIQSPLTRRRVKLASGASLSVLDDMIAEAKAACDAKLGCAVPRRTRYAGSGRMLRPY